ncbi:MAG: DUF1501 domain-containing protein [Acidimicrobiia bacterium]|nr:DUF1501 domain-containing protein [Acidimicrobiia bacterium]
MKRTECYRCLGAALARRDFLRAGTLSFLGMTLPDFLRFESVQARAATLAGNSLPKAKAQAVILVWLEGGLSQLESWDVKANGAFKTIPTSAPGIQVAEIFPRIAQHMDKLSVIRSMKTEERNHPQGTIQTLTGHRPIPALKFPSVGSIVAKEAGSRNNMPPFVIVPMPTEGDFFNYQEAYQAGFVGSEYDGMILPDPSRPDFHLPDLSLPKSVSSDVIADRQTLLRIVDRHFRQKEELAEFAKMDAFDEQALKMLLDPQVKKAFDLSQESEKTKDRYGRHRVGQSMLLARRLVEAGCRFVTAAGYKHGQWDTHGDMEQLLRGTLAPLLDQTLSALMEDLTQRGLLESTVVMVSGEFGRTPVINPKGGRDHWPDCWSLLVGGGGIAGGRIVGASDKEGAYVADRPVAVGDLYATIYKAMGIDWTQTYMSPIARPVYIANGFDDVPGNPLKELI